MFSSSNDLELRVEPRLDDEPDVDEETDSSVVDGVVVVPMVVRETTDGGSIGPIGVSVERSRGRTRSPGSTVYTTGMVSAE